MRSIQTPAGRPVSMARLRAALERCAVVLDVNEQAWIMRRAFDAILDDVEDN